jgi:hypothetical protein
VPLPNISRGRFHLDLGRSSPDLAKMRARVCFVCPLIDRRDKPKGSGKLPWNKPTFEPPGPQDMVLRLFDANTVAVKTSDTAPSYDELYWRESRMEERWEGSNIATTNAEMLSVTPVEVRPWPLPVPAKAPIDLAQHYRGFDLKAWVENYANREAWGTTSAMRLYIDPETYNPAVSVVDSNAGAEETKEQMEEARLADRTPLHWNRTRFKNEDPGCGLERAAIGVFRGLTGGKFTFSLSDQDVFVPFDMTHPERYDFVAADGSPLEHGEVYRRVCASDKVNLYLRARTWRYYVRVLVHYLWVNWFEEVYNDEWFLEVFFDRPPFYPIRQDVAHNSGEEMWHEWESAWLGYDPGIDYKWNHSQAAADMGQQIMAQQWWSMCEAYIYVGNEAACVTVWKCPPSIGEYVLGIGIVSRDTRQEHLVWARQKESVSDLYPRILLGRYWSDYTPTGGPDVGVWLGY